MTFLLRNLNANTVLYPSVTLVPAGSELHQSITIIITIQDRFLWDLNPNTLLLWQRHSICQWQYVIYIFLISSPFTLHLSAVVTSPTGQSSHILPCHVALTLPLWHISGQPISIRMFLPPPMYNREVILSQLLQPSWKQPIWLLESHQPG